MTVAVDLNEIVLDIMSDGDSFEEEDDGMLHMLGFGERGEEPTNELDGMLFFTSVQGVLCG